MKRICSLCLAACVALALFSGCGAKSQKFQYQFFDTFDTLIQVVGYAQSQEEFDAYAQLAHEEFRRFNELYDKFDDHGRADGIAAVNRSAGLAPVEVAPEVMDLVLFALGWQEETGGAVDITMGPVISIWQEYISRYSGGSEEATLPDPAALEEAAALCGTRFLEVDEEAGTLFLTQTGAALDVGAVAKGYATELVAQKLEAAGWQSFSISSGGNVRTCGTPQNGSESWSVGIQDPDSGAVLGQQSSLLEVVEVNNGSVVTSGDYQRFYMLGQRRLHHIIDPKTLMPADHYRSVTVVTADSGQADLFSTALFVMTPEQGKAFAQKHDLGVLWVLADGSLEYSDALLPLLQEK